MNDRIQELSYQCWYNDPDTGKEEFDRTKFAELIVRKCMEWCDAHATIDGTAQKIVESIKKDFGVEE